MTPAVLIIEPRREVADALEDLITSASYSAIVRPYVDRLQDLALTPAAIIVRISFESISEPPHAVIARLPADRPPVIAIACTDSEVAEARHLKCDVVLRAPGDVSRLCEVLDKLLQPRRAAPARATAASAFHPAEVPIGFDASRPPADSQ